MPGYARADPAHAGRTTRRRAPRAHRRPSAEPALSEPIFDPGSDTVTGPVVAGAPAEPELRVAEIQGNVLPGFATLRQRLLGLRFDPERLGAARTWLAGQVEAISTLAEVNDFRNVRRRALRREQPRPPSPLFRNVAFSMDGVRLLAPSADGIRDAAFTTGMYWRTSLGDPGRAGNRDWVVGGSEATTPHALFTLGTDASEDIRDAGDELLASIPDDSGIRCIYDQTGEVLEGDREHFGFRDGISQVGVRGRLSARERHYLARRYIDPVDPLARTHSRPGQALVWPGQFVFGYARQDPEGPDAGPEARGGEDWMRDGAYLVFRRLRQDVPLFRAFLAEQVAKLAAAGVPMTEDRLAGLLVGRWPNGTALMRNANGEDPDPMGDRLAVNHFGYATESPPVEVCDDPFVAKEPAAFPAPAGAAPQQRRDELRRVEGAPADATGRLCPHFAHIRKVNPRDLITDKGGPDDTLTRAMLRRGITWGAPYPVEPGARAADDGDRGLLFLAYMTSLEDQFETLNDDWMNRTAGPERSGSHDLLVGQSYRAPRTGVLWAGPTQAELATDRHWVIPTGGGYFFAPSISALRLFAAGD